MSGPAASDVIGMAAVGLRADGVTILERIDWHVALGECWVILGANGSGKTSLLRLAALERGPSRGVLSVLGNVYGRSDVRAVRRRIGFVSAAVLDRFRSTLTARMVVMTGKHAALEPWWHPYDSADEARAEALLAMVGCAHVIDRAVGDCSEGERKRILLARALMPAPDLLLLDEPCAGLDLGAREALLAVVDRLVEDGAGPTVVLSTHHLEEIPATATHALLMSGGRAVAAGPVAETVTSLAVSEAFGLAVNVRLDAGRFTARVA